MEIVGSVKGDISLAAYRGDAKTLLAFDVKTKAAREGLAGFTIKVSPQGVAPYYLINDLRFENPELHAQDPTEGPNSTTNAPIHKFRWLHVPGSDHQGLDPVFGKYEYTVTPRYLKDKRLLPIDDALSVSVSVDVAPFEKGDLKLGFTRGFVQSQAFSRHFGSKAPLRPKGKELVFDTNQLAGRNKDGEQFTFEDQYRWSGFTARKRIFDLLDEVIADKTLSLRVFAYDLWETGVVDKLLKIGDRARIILDDAALHHSKTKPEREDVFEEMFKKIAGDKAIKRGNFDRYAHHKVFVVSRGDDALKVLTGSTNFALTGMYVNSNHVLVFKDTEVASLYRDLFDNAWELDVSPKFRTTDLAEKRFAFGNAKVPKMEITFAPHTEPTATGILSDLIDRVNKEKTAPEGRGSVLFAVMELSGKFPNAVYQALSDLHKDDGVFSFGISDNPDSISLYKVGSKEGVLVTGKPAATSLPPPFQQIKFIGLGHQVHHKFIVCGFRGDDPTVYCGSSNLALLGEQENGDNLLCIRDADVATVFAIEALALVDTFNFLNGLDRAPDAAAITQPTADKREAAAKVGWFLGTTDAWVDKYFDPNDLKSKERELFAF